ncbi:MAG: hypothetical protein QOE41_703 [Mycobacterium sp.]|jgi:hypothetical protein|nr:hypothetical protein [Mycobacterium sp.]MDT5131392.1 hypothetical protein [Mycobacterium sp.]
MADDDHLPIPDYDQLPLAELQYAIRALGEDQLRTLIEHELTHGNRVHVLEVLHFRLEELKHGAQPSDGDPTRIPRPKPTPRGSPVSEATAAEPTPPPRHGVYSQTPHRFRP